MIIQIWIKFYSLMLKVTKTSLQKQQQKRFMNMQKMNVILKIHQISTCPGYLKIVQENEPDRFCFLLTFWPSAKVKAATSGIKGESMMPLSMARLKQFD